MADAPQPSNKAPWSELEQGFFAGAPSESQLKTPPPIRFDDLEPIPTPRIERRMNRRRAADVAVAERAELRPVLVRVGARCVPVLQRARVRVARVAGPAMHKLVGAMRAVDHVTRRETRRIVARVVAAIPTGSADRWAVASLAALFVLVGVSAVVVASRGGALTLPPAKTMTANVRASAKVAVAHVSPISPTPATTPAAVAPPVAAPDPLPVATPASPAPSRAAESRPAVVKVKRHRPHRRVALAPAGKVPAGKVAPTKPVSAPKKAIASAAPVRPAPSRPAAAPARSAPAPAHAAPARAVSQSPSRPVSRPTFSR